MSNPLYGYFGAANYTPGPVAIAEIADHCNLGVLGAWGCNSGDPLMLARWHIEQMMAGIAVGITKYACIIDVLVYTLPKFSTNPVADSNLWTYLTALRSAGVLNNVVALYPIDEPNGIIDEGAVLFTNNLIRRALHEIGRGDVALAVCYGGLERPTWWQRFLTRWLHRGNWLDKAMPLPGLADYDIVGGDAYELGAEILPQYDRLLARLRPEQRVMLVPGGCDPWRQDPGPFVAWARANADRVFAICPFTWFDCDGRAGIRNNGMAEAYRAAGKLAVSR
jgi:hypothetical protein